MAWMEAKGNELAGLSGILSALGAKGLIRSLPRTAILRDYWYQLRKSLTSHPLQGNFQV